MNNRIVFRNRVPDESVVEFWVDPIDENSEGTYIAAVTMIDTDNNLIFDNDDITSATIDNPRKSSPLKSGQVYSASIKVVFSTPSAKAITNHRIKKKDNTVYGGLYPHEVPETNVPTISGKKVGRQTIGIVMIKN